MAIDIADILNQLNGIDGTIKDVDERKYEKDLLDRGYSIEEKKKLIELQKNNFVLEEQLIKKEYELNTKRRDIALDKEAKNIELKKNNLGEELDLVEKEYKLNIERRDIALDKEAKNIELKKNNLDVENRLLDKQYKNNQENAKLQSAEKYGNGPLGKLSQWFDGMRNGTNLTRSQFQKATATNNAMDRGYEIINSLAQMANGFFDWRVASRKSELAETKNAFDKQQKLFKAHMEMSNAVANNVITMISTMATQTANQAARALAKGAKEEANARIKKIQSVEMAEREFGVAEKERVLQEEKSKLAGATEMANGAGSLVNNLFGVWGQAINKVVQGVVTIGKTIEENRFKFAEFDIEKMKQSNEMYNTVMDNITAVADKAKKIVDSIDETANAIHDKMLDNETIYKQAGLAFGFTGDTYSKYMREVQIQAAKTFNITAEQMKQMNEGFSNASGRTMIMSGGDYNNITAAANAFGVDQGVIASAIGEMNLFNMSVDHFAGEDGILEKMYGHLNKMGLSTSKFVQDLTQNLKLAQKYNFKGGADNMAKLTMWAEKTRFNLQSATNFADKMMSNNISDVLETSAKLQVLGGAASVYADPMSMMWEAGNDVGALAKRQYAMFSDITGSFNNKTGETTFTESDLRMIKARADAMGMNYEDVLNQKRQSNKQGVINKALSKYNLSEEALHGIGQRATYDTKTGQFMVSTLDGKKTLDQVAQMDDRERNRILMPENEGESLLRIAADTRSINTKMDAQLAYYQSTIGAEKWGEIMEASNINLKKQAETLEDGDYRKQIGDSILAQAKFAAKQQENTLKELKKNGNIISQYRDFAMQNAAKEALFESSELAILAAIAKENGIETTSSVVSKFTDAVVKDDFNTINGLLQNNEYRKLLENFGVNTEVNDAIGDANGGVIAGVSNVVPINDGFGTVARMHKNDQFIAAKNGGPIDRLFTMVGNVLNGNGMNSNTLKIDLSGNLNLTDSSGSINLVNIIKHDPVAGREFARMIIKSMDYMDNGKVTKNHNI